MNRGIKFVTTPIVIFTDANTSINSQSIREMVRYFNNPKVGCVAGEKRINMHTKDEAAVGGEGMYWKYESFLKKLDSQLHSAVAQQENYSPFALPYTNKCPMIRYWMTLSFP